MRQIRDFLKAARRPDKRISSVLRSPARRRRHAAGGDRPEIVPVVAGF
jgi:hypothetical protein